MRSIDNNGLILCDMQSKLFEKSRMLNCSSEIFIRRFMNSNIVKIFDSGHILEDTITIENIFEYIEEEYGESNYGTVKYSGNELDWIGYIYRYFCYTYQISSRQVYNIIKPKELRYLYEPYHTLANDQVIERILEAKKINLDPNYFERGLDLLRKLRSNNQ